jgi:hypothetical protein
MSTIGGYVVCSRNRDFFVGREYFEESEVDPEREPGDPLEPNCQHEVHEDCMKSAKSSEEGKST